MSRNSVLWLHPHLRVCWGFFLKKWELVYSKNDGNDAKIEMRGDLKVMGMQ